MNERTNERTNERIYLSIDRLIN